MKLDEIRNLNEKELATKVEELEEELFRLRLEKLGKILLLLRL